jgi:hypothetical protein
MASAVTATTAMASCGTVAATGRSIPGDAVQNAVEYLDSVEDVLECRGVAERWHRAVSDALGFINDRCWNAVAQEPWKQIAGRITANWHYRVHNTCRSSQLCTVVGLGPRLQRLQLFVDNVQDFISILRAAPELRSFTCELDGLNDAFSISLKTHDALQQLDLSLKGGSAALHVEGIDRCSALETVKLGPRIIVRPHELSSLPRLATLHLECRGARDLHLLSCPAVTELHFDGANAKAVMAVLSTALQIETLRVSVDRSAQVLTFQRDYPHLRQLHVTQAMALQVNFLPQTLLCVEGLERLPALQVLQLGSRCRLRSAEVLAALPKLRSVTLHDAPDKLAAIGCLPGLEALTLDTPIDSETAVAVVLPCSSLKALSIRLQRSSGSATSDALRQKTAIEKLTVWGSPETAIPPLHQLTSLREAAFTGRFATSAFESLGELASLKKLTVNDCPPVTDVAALTACRDMQYLDLTALGVTQAGIAGLEGMPALECITFRLCRALDNVSALRHSTTLTKLNLACSGVNDAGIAGLEAIHTLQTLSLGECNVSDVSALGSSTSLRELDLSYTVVNTAGIAGLERIPTLEILLLDGCQGLRDVSALRAAMRLKILCLRDSGVNQAGIAGLESCPRLQHVELGGCYEVQDVSALQAVRGLSVVWPSVTPLGSEDPAAWFS